MSLPARTHCVLLRDSSGCSLSIRRLLRRAPGLVAAFFVVGCLAVILGYRLRMAMCNACPEGIITGNLLDKAGATRADTSATRCCTRACLHSMLFKVGLGLGSCATISAFVLELELLIHPQYEMPRATEGCFPRFGGRLAERAYPQRDEHIHRRLAEMALSWQHDHVVPRCNTRTTVVSPLAVCVCASIAPMKLTF